MKFLDKLNLRRFAKVAAVAAVSSSLLFGGGDAVVNAAPDGVSAFREAYTANSGERAVHQDFTLIAPNFHLDVNSKAQAYTDGTVRMDGNFTWTYTNLKQNYSTNNQIPFYVEQTGNEMTLYVERNGRWSKMALPGLPTGIVIMWKTTDPSLVRANMDAVKAVEVIRDDVNMRIMNVTLDGKKVAAILEKNSQASLAGLSGQALAEQKEILNRWLVAIRANDITFAWTVNKPSWDTVTAAFDFTNVMRSYAKYVLDEAAAGRITLTDEERDLLDAMGYYAELKAYTSSIDPKDQVNITRPFTSAPTDDSSLDDIFYEMTTTVVR